MHRARAPGLTRLLWPSASPARPLLRVPASPVRLAARHASTAPESSLQIASRRLRSPVTWISASVTLGALCGLYQYQYTRQLTAQRHVGKPDLGGEFSLVDFDGKRVSSADLQGQWVLIYFGFTKCPDICPDELNKVTSVLERLEARGQPIQPVFITIDPARDTQARLKSYFATAGFHPRFIGLTGSFDEVRKACRAYRVYFTKVRAVAGPGPRQRPPASSGLGVARVCAR